MAKKHKRSNTNLSKYILLYFGCRNKRDKKNEKNPFGYQILSYLNLDKFSQNATGHITTS